MKLVVGLGNPGRKYQGTRHNVGFDVAAELARKFGVSKPKSKFQGDLVEANIHTEQVLLLCPTTYMNLSGNCVGRAQDFYKLPEEDLLIVCDDFNLPLSKLRFRAHGSSGGQKGLEDIIRRLGTEEFPRLRIGVGPVPQQWDPADFVLGKFTKDEAPRIEQAVRQAAEAVAHWVNHDMDDCMDQYNG